MSVHPTELKRVADGQRVAAELHDELQLDSLFDAEELWAAERVRFLRECWSSGVQRSELPQSRHWSWALKVLDLGGSGLGAFSAWRMFGIKCEGNWQGLLLAWSVNHVTQLDPKGRDLVYVDLVESAPWNWSQSKANRHARFRGVGWQLIELAVQWSLDLGFKGRLGLHSLPQAEDRYRDSYLMTDVGPDANYQGLRYFEFTEQQAQDFIT